jgi:hypothetical protein
MERYQARPADGGPAGLWSGELGESATPHAPSSAEQPSGEDDQGIVGERILNPVMRPLIRSAI